MKIEDLKDKWAKTYAIGSVPVLLTHDNMKTVKFWPTGLDQNDTHYKMNGWWICIQTEEPIVQEQIHIKKEDLDKWHIVED